MVAAVAEVVEEVVGAEVEAAACLCMEMQELAARVWVSKKMMAEEAEEAEEVVEEAVEVDILVRADNSIFSVMEVDWGKPEPYTAGNLRLCSLEPTLAVLDLDQTETRPQSEESRLPSLSLWGD